MKPNDYIKMALRRASEVESDIPVCAVIEKDGEIIAVKTNQKEASNQTIAHAEILAIAEANLVLKSWRLEGCNMYVTLEPCPMCAWAIIMARINNLYFGSYDTKYGAFSCGLNLREFVNSKLCVVGGIEEEKCNKLLGDYFAKLRNEKNT